MSATPIPPRGMRNADAVASLSLNVGACEKKTLSE